MRFIKYDNGCNLSVRDGKIELGGPLQFARWMFEKIDVPRHTNVVIDEKDKGIVGFTLHSKAIGFLSFDKEYFHASLYDEAVVICKETLLAKLSVPQIDGDTNQLYLPTGKDKT